MPNSSYSHRKSEAKFRFVDAAGRPVANTAIDYKLICHEFLFGVGAFDTLPATAVERPGNIDFYQDKIVSDKSFYRDRANKLVQTFNYGTIPFYWGGFEPMEGQPLTESRMLAAQYLKAHGVRVKGHPLCWHTACADWLMQYDNKTILKKQLERIHRDVTAFKGMVDMWDVINEVVIMPAYDRYDNAITRICREYGQVGLVKMVFDAAKESNPDAVLLINDFNLSDSYRKLIADCLDAGAPISAIGLQSHQHQGYRGKEYFEQVLERFSVFGLPLHFTENTLVSGKIMPPDIVDLNDYQVEEWPSTPSGEERQCREWKEMYEMLFAHPLVEAVTCWDFADGAWLHAPSGLIRADNSVKPVYKEMNRLIHEEWSSCGTLRTDADGAAWLEGYRGAYQFTAPTAAAVGILEKNSEKLSVIVLQ